VRAVVADFEETLGLSSDSGGLDDGGVGRRLVAFLGFTIGNMTPAQRAAFLSRVRARLRPADGFLLGTDLVEDPAVLVAAYDDSGGVTSAFNKNVLVVLNARLGADFDPNAYEHVVAEHKVNRGCDVAPDRESVRDLSGASGFAWFPAKPPAPQHGALSAGVSWRRRPRNR